MVKVIYLRVSNKDLSYEDQLPYIINKFELKQSECVVLTEKISAFNEESQAKRKVFIELKDMIGRGEVDNLYVYKVDRLERNMKRMFTLFFYCEENDCRIYSAEEPMINQEFEVSAQGDFLRYINILLFGTQAQGESENTSKRTSKAVVKKEGKITKSSYGNKWGKSLKYVDGKNVSMKVQTEVNDYLIERLRYYLNHKFLSYYNLIMADVLKKHSVIISKTYIHKVKEKWLQEKE